ncbi:MAG: glycoside hydrolase family 25 protein [Lachnospiraceae bacterium]|nr:glycoside hydrolase family 25 protein [Lachnospiraceae bacterium]
MDGKAFRLVIAGISALVVIVAFFLLAGHFINNNSQSGQTGNEGQVANTPASSSREDTALEGKSRTEGDRTGRKGGEENDFSQSRQGSDSSYEKGDEILDLKDAGLEPIENPKSSLDESRSRAERTQLTLLLSSVDRDIRMIITDREGRPVEGVPFRCEVSGNDETLLYEDSDEDGVLYAANLLSGRYNVHISYAPGYVSPLYDSMITVRESISYTAVSDIKALIRTEEEIDPVEEDTADIEEEDDGELLETGEIDLESGSIGIDVSKYNKEIDWPKVKKSGIDYVIIRLGYRGSSTGTLVEDPYFRKNLDGALAAGMKVGVYFFTQALNATEAVEEASMVASLVEPDQLSLPVFLDVESSGGRADPLDPAVRTANINAFCETIVNSGFQAGVYANKRWFTNLIRTEDLGDWKIWLAQYRVKHPTYKGSYDCWQYSSKGDVEGIEGPVDLDLNLSL